jgi:hypothetical protein
VPAHSDVLNSPPLPHLFVCLCLFVCCSFVFALFVCLVGVSLSTSVLSDDAVRDTMGDGRWMRRAARACWRWTSIVTPLHSAMAAPSTWACLARACSTTTEGWWNLCIHKSGGVAEGAGAGEGEAVAGGGGGVVVEDEVEGMVSRMISGLNAITLGCSAESPFVHASCTHTALHHYYQCHRLLWLPSLNRQLFLNQHSKSASSTVSPESPNSSAVRSGSVDEAVGISAAKLSAHPVSMPVIRPCAMTLVISRANA